MAQESSDDTPTPPSNDGSSALDGLAAVRRTLDADDDSALDALVARAVQRRRPTSDQRQLANAEPDPAQQSLFAATNDQQPTTNAEPDPALDINIGPAARRVSAPTIARRTQRRVLPGEWRTFIGLAAVAALTALTLEISYVLSVSGFLTQVGVAQTPLLWLVDMAIILVTSGVYALVVDRVARQRLMGWLVLGLAGIYVVFRLLFAYGAPSWLTYAGLFLLAEQQYTIVPLAFYALASDVYNIAQAKRLFPLIAGAGLLGQVLGSALAGSWAQLLLPRGIGSVEMLVVNALLLLASFGVLHLALHRAPAHSRRDERPASLRDVITTGLDFVRNVPSFRALTLAMLGAGFVLTIIEFHFLLTSDRAFADAASFQTFYGFYRVGLTLATLAVQSLVTGWMLKRVGLKSAFLVLPAALLAAIAGMLAAPGIVGGAAGRFLGRLAVVSVDGPSRQALQGLIPEERRGRVSTFMGSYLYALGTIAGALLLELALRWLNEPTATLLYLVLGGVASVGALAAAWRLRTEYDMSLLDWRLARRRRRSAALIESVLNVD